MTTYTEYQRIERDESGAITRVDAWRQIGHPGRQVERGVTERLQVLSIEPGPVCGWGGAEAIGLVGGSIDCDATRFGPATSLQVNPMLCLLR